MLKKISILTIISQHRKHKNIFIDSVNAGNPDEERMVREVIEERQDIILDEFTTERYVEIDK